MMHFALALIVGISLTSHPAIAKDPRDNRPSAGKQQYCERMMKRFGRRSVQFNSNWYGKGVVRPKSNAKATMRPKTLIFL